MRSTFVRYEAPGWGVGELWLDGGRVLWSELPRTRHVDAAVGGPRTRLVRRLQRYFAGAADSFDDVELDLGDDLYRGFYGDCAQALRAVPRGEVVTYGELAALAGRPGAGRAAGTFCGRCGLSPFVPTHRVVAAGGIGSYGDLGIGYKRRLLALEGVLL